MAAHTLWVEKYRPKTIEDCVLPEEVKNIFLGIIKKNNIPNMLFYGTAGVGKTTVAKALCNDLGAEVLFINASKDRNIDTLRTTIQSFVSTISLSGGRKVVILDEADNLNIQSTQPALRAFIEESANNCSFILTCNFKNKIMEAIHSRMATFSFSVTKDNKQEMCKSFMRRCSHILKSEGIGFEPKAVASLVVQHFPDYRKVINEMQKFASINSKIDIGILSHQPNINFESLKIAFKKKDMPGIITWCTENMDTDPEYLYLTFRTEFEPHLKRNGSNVLDFYKIVYEFYRDSFVIADKNLGVTTCMLSVLGGCEFNW